MWVNSSTESLSALPQPRSRWTIRTWATQSNLRALRSLCSYSGLTSCSCLARQLSFDSFLPVGLSYLLLHSQSSRLISLDHLFNYYVFRERKIYCIYFARTINILFLFLGVVHVAFHQMFCAGQKICLLWLYPFNYSTCFSLASHFQLSIIPGMIESCAFMEFFRINWLIFIASSFCIFSCSFHFTLLH